MKLLVFTQKVDKNDPILGFFHTWIIEISKRAEEVIVICLYKGDVNLPKNVTVYSLGKERGVSKFIYIKNLYHYLFLIRGSYDKVFVHMNQEYVLLAGIYWKLGGIPVYMWRNHKAGNMFTRVAIVLSSKVFCTSRGSFTAKFKKTVIMPAGVDTKTFKQIEGMTRKKYSVCMVGRVSPVKKVDLALEAVEMLVSKGVQVSFNIIGPVLEKDLGYCKSLKKYIADHNLLNAVSLSEAVAPNKLSEVYSSYEICLNLTDSGSFDKTIIEASICGAIPLVSNSSLRGMLPEVCITEPKPKAISDSLVKLLNPHVQIEIQNDLLVFVKSQSLDALMEKLFTEIK